MPVRAESIPMLPGLSPVGGKVIVARFDGGGMSSDGGLLALREVEQRLAIVDRPAAFICDPREPSRVLSALVPGFRPFLILAWRVTRFT